MAIPVIIVSGFLGCGKTTFLHHLLPRCGVVGLRPALIINEVGDVDVDGELLADLHAEQARLVGGCVCCTLQSQLAGTLYDLLERQAGDVIIIECSGLSNPIDVLSALSAPALLREIAVSHIVCLLDVARADKLLQVTELARVQVAGADVLILNKLDRVDTARRERLTALIDGVNTRAVRHWASYGDIGNPALDALLTAPAPVRCACGEGHAHDYDHDHDHAHTHELPSSFCTVALPLPSRVERAALETLLRDLPDNVIRAKGFAAVSEEGWHVIQMVYDAFDITPLHGAAPAIGAVLVCIGQHLEPAKLQALVREALEPDAVVLSTQQVTPKLLRGSVPDIGSLYNIACANPIENRAWVDFLPLTEEQRIVLGNITGFDLSWYTTHTIDVCAVQHIMNFHEQQGKLSVTREDFLCIPEIIAHPDTIYPSKTDLGLDAIVYEKRINGFVIYVEELRSGRGKLATTTLKKVRAGSPALRGDNTPSLTSGTVPGSPANSNYTTIIADVKSVNEKTS